MKSPIFYLLLLITFALLAWGTYQALVVAPPEATMGDAQRIFYYHVPAATAASILFGINFLASIWYLWKRNPQADALAVAGAEVGLLIAWFRYDIERTGQVINALHIQKAARGSLAMMMPAPAMFLFVDDKLLHEKMVQHRYMVAGYIAVWTIYLGYLLFLFAKLRR